MNLADLLNTAWMFRCAPEATAIRRATRNVAATQAKVLRGMLQRNQDTEFGRAHDFGRLASPRDYQQRVPLSRNGDYAAAMERIAEGKQGVLTAERVRLLEPTSGTTGGEKLIPYTDSLRRQFQRALAVWIFNLFRHRPRVRAGRAYWSIQPAVGPPRRTTGGVPIGFDDDAAYLGRLEQLALKRLLVVPTEVSRLGDLESWRYLTLRHLLAASDLALISVWNPTFLPALLAPLERWTEPLCRDLSDGARRRNERERAAFVAAVLGSSSCLAEKLRRLWPRLALVSCWADASDSLGAALGPSLAPAVQAD